MGSVENMKYVEDGEERISPPAEKRKPPTRGRGLWLILFLSLVLTKSSFKDMFSDLSITPKD
jgi:hypothetical protein